MEKLRVHELEVGEDRGQTLNIVIRGYFLAVSHLTESLASVERQRKLDVNEKLSAKID